MKTDASPLRWPWRQGAVLSVLPLLLIGLYFAVSQVSGPYFYSANVDPDYAYFFNGLNIATGRSPFHIDHPGTPVQLLVAGIINVCSRGEPTGSIIASSEEYLRITNALLFVFLLASFTVAGALIFRRTRRLGPPLLFQASLAFLGVNIYCLSRANPEPAMLGIALLLGVLIYLDAAGASENSTWRFVFASAFLCATGAACKLTFTPLVLLPLLLIRGRSRQGSYVALLVLFFTIWLWPDYGSLDRFIHWVKSLASHTGHYGTGPTGWADGRIWFVNFIYLASQNFTFIALLLVSLLVPLKQWRASRKISVPARRLLLVCVVESLQFAMVCKYHENRYLIPALGLAGLNVLLLGELLKDSGGRKWLGISFALLIFAGAGQGVWTLIKLHRSSVESAAIVRQMETTHRNSIRIYGYAASSLDYARYFGNEFSGGLYDHDLRRLNPDEDRVFFYDFSGFYHDRNGPISWQKIMQKNGNIILQATPSREGDPVFVPPPGLKWQEKFGGEQEKIYEITR